MKRGKFIVFEGIDGAGTTTQVPLLGGYLFEKDRDNSVLLTREPTMFSPEGQELRRRLTNKLLPDEEVIKDPHYWARLFVQDRKVHLEEHIVPALERGQQVICDRYKMSTLAYQSVQGCTLADLIAMQSGFYVPDLTLLLDVSVSIAESRTRKRTVNGTVTAGEYFEFSEFQEKVQKSYLEAATELSRSERVVVIDSSLSIAAVQALVKQEADILMGYKK